MSKGSCWGAPTPELIALMTPGENIGRLIRKIENPLLLRHLDRRAAAHETRLGRGKRQRARM